MYPNIPQVSFWSLEPVFRFDLLNRLSAFAHSYLHEYVHTCTGIHPYQSDHKMPQRFSEEMTHFIADTQAVEDTTELVVATKSGFVLRVSLKATANPKPTVVAEVLTVMYALQVEAELWPSDDRLVGRASGPSRRGSAEALGAEVWEGLEAAVSPFIEVDWTLSTRLACIASLHVARNASTGRSLVACGCSDGATWVFPLHAPDTRLILLDSEQSMFDAFAGVVTAWVCADFASVRIRTS